MYSNLVFSKVSSLEKQLAINSPADNLEKSVGYVLDYCNRRQKPKDGVEEYLKNSSDSNHAYYINLTVSLCKFIRDETTHYQGTRIPKYTCEIPE